MDLSVVIINFNTKELTAQTVRSIFQTVKEISFEIIVVDNSTNPDESYRSTDERITVLEKVENHGFGHACNFGASHAKGDYLLFLNSDTIVGEGALDRTVEYIRKPMLRTAVLMQAASVAFRPLPRLFTILWGLINAILSPVNTVLITKPFSPSTRRRRPTAFPAHF